MFAATPFLGIGVVEFDGAIEGLRIDARLVKDGAEPPSTYVAIAGAEPGHRAGLRAGAAAVSPRWRHAWPPGRRNGVAAASRCGAAARGDRRAARAPASRRRGPRGAGRRDREAAAGVGRGGRVGPGLTRRTAEEMAAVTERHHRRGAFPSGPSPEVDHVRVQLAEMESARRRRRAAAGGDRGRGPRAAGRRSRTRSSGCGWPRASSGGRGVRRLVSRRGASARRRRSTREALAARDRAIAERDERIAASRLRSRSCAGGWPSSRTSCATPSRAPSGRRRARARRAAPPAVHPAAGATERS